MKLKEFLLITIPVFVLLLGLPLKGDDDFTDELMADDTLYEAVWDPLEPANRVVYHTYKGIYDYGGIYIVKGFKETPSYTKDRMYSFAKNVEEIQNSINHFLQLRINAGFESFFRFTINSTVGILGLWDVMDPLGMPRKYNDFGATFYFYGVKEGPYLIIFGPYGLRDTLGIFSTFYTEIYYLPPSEYLSIYQYEIKGIEIISINVDTMIDILFYAEYYHDYNDYLSRSLDQYTLIKTTFIDIRRKKLQEISAWD